jgi:ribosome-binding factor A
VPLSGEEERFGLARHRQAGHHYPRTARVNALLQVVLAEELERLADIDARLRMVTVTGVETDRDLSRARVYFDSLGEATVEALAEHRKRLQAAVGAQVRMRRTPLLEFVADPAIAAAQRLEVLLRRPRQEEAGEGGAE